MEKNIYLHIDLFSPSVYTKLPGDASPPPVYMIIQPYIFGDASLDCPKLLTYINDINLDAPADYRYVVVDETFNTGIWGQAYPVPLPFNAQLFSDGSRINRMQNEMGYVFASFAAQVDWMINSMSAISVTIEEFAKFGFLPFSDKDKEVWWNDLLAVLTNYIEKKDDVFASRNIDNTNVPIFTEAMLNRKTDAAGISLMDLLKLLERKRLQKTPADEAITISQAQKENAFRNYAAALTDIQNDAQRKSMAAALSLSSITLTRQHLEALKTAGEDNLRMLFGNFKGYLRSLAAYFKNVYDKTEDGPAGTDKKGEALVNALHNYFYFGERTRITALADNSFHILPLADKDSQADAPLVTTTVLSLAGQVINLSAAGALSIRSLNEAGNDPNTKVPISTATLADQVALITLNSAENNRDSFERELEYLETPSEVDWNGLHSTLDANIGLTRAQRQQVFDEIRSTYGNLGKASYLPSNSLAKKSDIYQELGADKLRLFSLPQYILDGLDASGRVNYSNSFAQKNPGRSAISYPAELANYSISEINDGAELPQINDYLTQFIPALFFKITATLVRLPIKQNDATDELVYKLSLKAAADEEGTANFEQGLINYLFHPQNGPLNRPDLFNICLLSEGGIVLESIEPINKTKKDNDELIELYITAKKSTITKEQYDLIIYPKDKSTVWQSGNEFYLNTLLFPRQDPVMAPLFIQNRYFNFKYHHSLNGLNTYVRLQLGPSASFKESHVVAGVDMQPVLEDHLNFNKFRLQLQSGAGAIGINKSDALRPVFEYIETVTGAGPKHYNWVGLYKVLHRFSEELGTKGFGKSTIPPEYETEWNRYLLFKNCGTRYALKGKPENQYALRLDTQDSDALALGNSSNVASLALLTVKDKAGDGTPINLPALTYEYNQATKKIRLRLNKEYFKLIVAQGTNKSRYRPVYEAMFELIQAEQANLVVEGWSFDNSLFDLPLEKAVHPELANEIPTHPRYLKRAGADVKVSIAAFIADIKAKFDKDDIKQFEQAVSAFDGIASSEIDCPGTLQNAELLRVRLNIFRKKDNSVAANFKGVVADNDITPDEWDNFKSANGSQEYKVKLQASLKDEAKGQLSRIVTPTIEPADALPIGGNLFYSSAFITVDNTKLAKALLSNLSLMLGENISFTAFNYDLANPVPAGKPRKYADLYYIPYAVLPLKTVEALGNATETLLFAQYLMKILLSLTYPARAKEDIASLLGTINWDIPGSTAVLKMNLDTMIAARQVLNETIAPQLAKLVTYVDDRDIEPQSPHNDMKQPYKLLLDIYNVKGITPELEKYFRSLFTAKPELFSSSKGFGIGLLKTVFENGGVLRNLAFSSLYSLEVNKVINTNKKDNDPQPEVVQVNNTFDFTSIYKTDKAGDYRVFVDVLDDEMFDNEFEISPDTRNNKRSGIQLKNNLRVVSETAQNVYVDSNDTGESINLVHYVDEWKDKKDPADIKQYYLLPSRRPPQRPSEQTVFNKIYYKNSDTTDVANMAIQVTDKLFTETELMLKLNHGAEYTVQGSSAAERVGKWTQLAGMPGLKKGYATDASIIRFEQEHTGLWKKYDKYISVYTFSIEPDEEAADLGNAGPANQFPFKGFENDKIRIYFKLSGSSSAENNVAGTADKPGLKTFIPLYESYKKRLRGENDQPTVAMSSIFDPARTGEGLTQALLDVLTPLHDQGTAVVSDAFSDNVGVINITDDGSKKGFQVSFTKNGGNFTVLLGAVLYKDIFDNNGKPAARFYLSIAVLEDPWTHSKMRLQVDRNSRDFNHDGDPDINPRFEMFSEFSDWADHGQAMLDYNFWDGDGEDNKQLGTAYPPDLMRVKFASSIAGQYESNIGSEKTIERFYERAMRLTEGRFDKEQLKNAPMRVLISHRTTTNQVIELSRETTDEFIANFNKGKIGYRDEFIKQKIDTDVCKSDVTLRISPDVTAMYPFIRIIFYDKTNEIPVLSVNLQLQWEG